MRGQPFYRSLYVQVLIAIMIGAALGTFWFHRTLLSSLTTDAAPASGCSSYSPLITEELRTTSKEIRQLLL